MHNDPTVQIIVVNLIKRTIQTDRKWNNSSVDHCEYRGHRTLHRDQRSKFAFINCMLLLDGCIGSLWIEAPEE